MKKKKQQQQHIQTDITCTHYDKGNLSTKYGHFKAMQTHSESKQTKPNLTLACRHRRQAGRPVKPTKG